MRMTIPIDPRGLLMAFGLGMTALACSAPADADDELPARPNVLLIMFDDLNDWALHPPEHPKARTPNLDRLRQTSVSFTNAHAVVPVCGPSRKCLFSGLYPQTLDDYGFTAWSKVPALRGCVPLPLCFRSNGYDAYGTGKLLHEGAGGDFYTAYGIGPNYGPFRDTYEAWKGQWKDHFQPRWLNHTMYHDLSFGPLANAGKMPDEVSADWAKGVLGKQHDRPFYLAVGFIRPHTPLHVPQKYFDLFPLEAIQLPPYLEHDRDDCASVLRNRWQHGFEKFRGLIDAGGETKWREWVQAYLACAAFADQQAGKVLDALEASPYRDNTIVLLTSDHGYHVGEKDCVQKWHLWDESTRVPLFIRVPGSPRNGATCEQPVSLIDVYPTLLDLCGLPEHPNRSGSNKPLEGHSLRPLLENPDNGGRGGPAVAFMGIRDGNKNPHFSVRSERYRYTLCANGEEELYDHDRDPNEWTNLAGDPAHAETRKKLREELTAVLRRTTIPDGFPAGGR